MLRTAGRGGPEAPGIPMVPTAETKDFESIATAGFLWHLGAVPMCNRGRHDDEATE
ncbi:hypothetical protein GCM10025857_25470 [Alicyclobacillus contaminans]|nr:hypothetical protein GCM10025857_25470 [Alicyclobacillus contaminans]